MPKKLNQKNKHPQNEKQNKIPKPVVCEIDAAGKVLGRLATKIAIILRGKDKPSFRPYLLMGEKVKVINASKMIITGNKLEEKKYYRHTGYLGHLKVKTMKELMVDDPAEVLRRAVYGMLPKNKLRDKWMKNLTIES